MDLKKLSDLERQVAAPHEQDDPTVAHDPYAQLARGQAGLQAGGVTIPTTARSVSLTQRSMIQALMTRPPQYRVIVAGADPRVTMDGDELIVVMEGGREMVFHNGANPIDINGDERMFRLTKQQAKELAVKLVKMAASEQ